MVIYFQEKWFEVFNIQFRSELCITLVVIGYIITEVGMQSKGIACNPRPTIIPPANKH